MRTVGPMSDASRSGGWIVPLAGGLGALMVDVLYLLAIAQQGTTPPGAEATHIPPWMRLVGPVVLLVIAGAAVAIGFAVTDF
jgi:hypothetical protein